MGRRRSRDVARLSSRRNGVDRTLTGDAREAQSSARAEEERPCAPWRCWRFSLLLLRSPGARRDRKVRRDRKERKVRQGRKVRRVRKGRRETKASRART